MKIMPWYVKTVARREVWNKLKPFIIRCFTGDNLKGGNDLPEINADEASASRLLEEEGMLPFQAKATVTNPSETSVLLFPGQGSQYVGMADGLLDYPNVREMFNAASDILKIDLLNYCKNGPVDELNKTVHCQPAIMVTSLAGVEKLQVTQPEALENCVAAAGFSVGEYAALVFSGAMTFEDAVRLVGIRSRAMQRACVQSAGGMVAAVGTAKTRFKTVCLEARDHCFTEFEIENPVCSVSAYLCPNAVTIGGHHAAIDFIKKNARRYDIRKVTPIPVSGAFHTELMRPALTELRGALRTVPMQEPLISLYSNVTGKKYHSITQIRQDLTYQVVNPVKWEQNIHALFSRSQDLDVPNIFDVGPGRQLGPVLKKCNGKAYKSYMPMDGV